MINNQKRHALEQQGIKTQNKQKRKQIDKNFRNVQKWANQEEVQKMMYLLEEAKKRMEEREQNQNDI